MLYCSFARSGLASVYSSLIIIVCLCLSCFTNPAIAEVTWSGDVDPNDPTTWEADMTVYIGKTADGTLDIKGGSNVLSGFSLIGYESGATGEVTVDGIGSTWAPYGVYVGKFGTGSGVLNITGGGTVSAYDGHIGYGAEATGEVTVDGAGSTWTNSSWVYVGYSGSGALNITNGGAVSSGGGVIGDSPGSTGVVTVDGIGSTWDIAGGAFELGDDDGGNGTLDITNGGNVSSEWGYIGYSSGSTGVVTVDGAGSTWTNSKTLSIGNLYSDSSNGTLNITDGGLVSVAETLTIGDNGDRKSVV